MKKGVKRKHTVVLHEIKDRGLRCRDRRNFLEGHVDGNSSILPPERREAELRFQNNSRDLAVDRLENGRVEVEVRCEGHPHVSCVVLGPTLHETGFAHENMAGLSRERCCLGLRLLLFLTLLQEIAFLFASEEVDCQAEGRHGHRERVTLHLHRWQGFREVSREDRPLEIEL